MECLNEYSGLFSLLAVVTSVVAIVVSVVIYRKQKKEQEKQLRKAKKVVETIEAELADIEKRIAEYDAKFAAAAEYDEAGYKAYNELKNRYEHQMHEWEKASYELEITEGE